MDIDISDILADISRPIQIEHADLSQPYSSYDAESTYADYVLLTRAWTTERCTPTLQPYPASLISRTMTRIRTQISKIEDLTAGIYDGYQNFENNQANLNLILSILQTDLSRHQFLMRSYLRQRLAKISKYATYYAKYHLDAEQTDEKASLLSSEEAQFLTYHQTLLRSMYESSFLMSLPANLRRLDDNAGGGRMDEGPDEATGVVVRCLAREWNNERDVYDESSRPEDEKATVELKLERGGILIARWRDVRSGVEQGNLEVL